MSGEKAMKTAMVMALMAVLLASTAYAADSAGLGNVDIIGSNLNNIKIFSSDSGSSDMEKHLDIVGSKLENIKIFSDDANLGDTEVVGSSINNVEILPAPEHQKKSECKKDRRDDTICYWDSACKDYSHDKPSVTCSKPHLGVDAWYGNYWFNNQIYTPKWPQMY
jgi:hypothetical protein